MCDGYYITTEQMREYHELGNEVERLRAALRDLLEWWDTEDKESIRQTEKRFERARKALQGEGG